MTVFAPRNRMDFALKAMLLIAAIGGLNYARELVLHGQRADTLGVILRDAAIVGTPFVVVVLLVVRHLDRLQRQLANLAATDLLTGLPNRRGFLEAVAQGGRIDRDGLLLLLDVDHFKRVNDTYGHAVGDICLQAVARHLRSLSRVGDGIGRFGGEEFVMFLPGAGPERLDELSRLLTKGVEVRAGATAEAGVQITMSAGAVLARAGTVADAALNRADAALYRAKEEGRARLVLTPDAA